MFFRDIIGQDEVKRRLIRSVADDRIPHAQLLAGPEGVGKLPLAIAYARYLCCENRGADDSCGTCPSCVKYNKLIHTDLHFVFPVIKSGVSDTYVKTWRQLVTTTPYFGLPQWLAEIGTENQQAIIYEKESSEVMRKLRLKSNEGGYKIMIIWLPEKMHVACANKLLKLLEEPPEQTLFLLVSEAPDLLLTTIVSRTQRINVGPIPEGVLTEALQQRQRLQPADAADVAHISGGSYVKALEVINASRDHQLYFDLFVDIMRLAYMRRKVREMKEWSEQVAGLGRERQRGFLQYGQRMIRESFVYNFHQPQMNYMSGDERNFATRFAPYVNEGNVVGIIEQLDLAQQHIEANVNAKMVFFDFALQLTVLLKH